MIKNAESDINSVTVGGETPLIKAVIFGKSAAVSELLSLGANAAIKTDVSSQ